MVVMAQVVEWSLQTLGIRGSNPVISKFYNVHSVNCIGKTKIN